MRDARRPPPGCTVSPRPPRSSGGGFGHGRDRPRSGRRGRAEPRSAQAGPTRVTPKPVALSRKPGGHGDGAHVEQVHEVGVEAEVAVQRHRLGQHLVDAVDGRRCGQQQHVDCIPQRLGLRGRSPAERRGRGRLDAADPDAALQDGADHRVDRRRVGLQQALHRRRALGDPRAAVEQLGGFQERARCRPRPASRPPPASRSMAAANSAAASASPKNWQLVRPRHAEAEARRRSPVAVPARGANRGRAASKPAATLSTRAASAASAANTVTQSSERQAGTTPRVLQRPLVGFSADEAIERRRHAAGAGGVGAEGEGDEPRRHRHGRAGARSAADIGAVVDAAGRAVGTARPDQAGGELVEVGLAHDDRAGRLQAFDDRR